MKKLFLLMVMCCIASMTAFAQENKWRAGVNIGYGTDISKPFIGVRAQYDIIEQLSIAPSFNYYFKSSEDIGYGEEIDYNYWDIDVDVHWNVLRGESYKVYPLVGLTYLHGKASYEGESESDSWIGANVGVGAQLNFGTNWCVGIEAKYQIVDEVGQFVPMATIMYRF